MLSQKLPVPAGVGAEGANARAEIASTTKEFQIFAGESNFYASQKTAIFVKALGVMNLPQMNKTAAILITSLLSMVAITPQVTAAPKNPKVTSVELDTDAGTMVVTGRYLGGKKFRGDVRLHLAETGPITLKVDKYKKLQPTDEVPILLQQLKLSGIPQNIDDFEGVHLLEVRRKYREQVDGVSVVKYQIGTSLVTIGAVGPAGPKGDTGDAGPKGDQGAQGPKGDAGVNGTDGTNGTNGKDGEQGPAGTNGSDGVGVSQTTIDADGNLIVTLTNGSEINAGQVGNSNSTLKLSKQSELFDFAGGTGSVDIQSDTDWTWEIEADGWISSSFDRNSQNGNQTFTYEVDELYGDTSREASILFQSTNGPKYEWYFTVRQEPNPAGFFFEQLGADIDGEATDKFSGYSVSLSADGSTIAISAACDVRIYQYINSSWVQQGADIDIKARYAQSGTSVSLSADGSTVAIGLSSGRVCIYQYDGSSWIKRGADIDYSVNYYGRSVSLSADGSTVAIGADGQNQVRVYQYDGSSWVQLGADIDGEEGEDFSGFSVSLSSDGNIVAIGAVLNDGNGTHSGHVRIYQYIDSSWVQQGADIDGEEGYDQSGFSVSLSADGSTVAIGAPKNYGDGYESGHVRIYQYDGSIWKQLGTDIDGEEGEDFSGFSVSLSADGRTVAIGAPFNKVNGSELGHVRIYRYSGSNWQQLGTDIDGETEGDQSGRSVSLSDDGRTVAIGAPFNDANGTDSGHVRVYQLTQEP